MREKTAKAEKRSVRRAWSKTKVCDAKLNVSRKDEEKPDKNFVKIIKPDETRERNFRVSHE